MNKTVKVLLLLIGVALAIVCIMVFAETMMSPPEKLSYDNQYSQNMNEKLGSLKKGALDSAYYITVENIDFLYKEKKIGADDHKKLMGKFADIYVPVFLGNCNAEFNSSTWHDNKHPFMRTRSNELREWKISGSNVLNKARTDSLAWVVQVLNDYNTARGISRNSVYQSNSQAENAISSARKYAQMKPLSNNTDLVASLNRVASNIGDSHYNQISNAADAFVRECDRRIRDGISNDDGLDRYCNQVLAKISNYETMQKWYPNSRNTSGLRSRVTNKFKEVPFFGE